MDLKNTLEVIALSKETAVQVKAALADKNLDWRDIPRVVALFGPAKKALDGIKDVPAEIKDLDEAEANQLMAACMDMATAWAAVFEVAA
jgi:hypothetical protein